MSRTLDLVYRKVPGKTLCSKPADQAGNGFFIYYGLGQGEATTPYYGLALERWYDAKNPRQASAAKVEGDLRSGVGEDIG